MTTIITIMKIIDPEPLKEIPSTPVWSETSFHPDDYDPSCIKSVAEEEVILITPEPNKL